jgi:ubiquinol-cytochrome c reductase iron-sulfur subunit
MLEALQKLAPAVLLDPESRRNRLPTPAFARNVWRSRKPEIFVCFGQCSHLGCTPLDKFQAGAQAGLPADWPGGFVCPCHGSSFDLAGRVFKNKIAVDNLEVPPYVFLSDTQLLIGAEDVTQATASHG